MRAGVARQKQAQAFIDASRRCFDAGQSGAIGAEPYAFILVFAEAVGVVIDVPFAPPPLAVTMAFGGAGRRVVVLIQNIVTEARNVFRDLRALLERLGVVIRLMDVFERQARQREAYAEVDVGQGAADGVTALKYGYMRVEERVHGGVAVRGKLHIGERIGVVVVLPRRVDHQVGFERLQ